MCLCVCHVLPVALLLVFVGVSMSARECLRACLRSCVLVCVCACVRVCIYACLCACLGACVCACRHARMFVCVCVPAYRTSLLDIGVLSSPGRCCSRAKTMQLAMMVARIMYSNGVERLGVKESHVHEAFMTRSTTSCSWVFDETIDEHLNDLKVTCYSTRCEFDWPFQAKVGLF